MRILQKIKCFFGFHKFKVFPPGIEEHVSVGETENDRHVYPVFASTGYKQCAICGKVKK
jgi:hypothetical protein